MKRTHLTQTVNQVKTEISVSDVVVFMAQDKYTNAHTHTGQVFLLDDPKGNSIIALLAEFGDEFIVAKRGCLVRKTELESVKRMSDNSGYQARLKSGAFVTISRREAPIIRKMIGARSAVVEEVEQ